MTTENTPATEPAAEAPTVDPTPITIGEAVAAVPVTPDATNTEAVEYEKTGDVGLDMALDFIGKAGLASNHPAVLAASEGDFSILKATLAAKGVTGWEQFVALGEAAYSRASAENATKATAARAAIYKEAGGEESWKSVQAWAGANATPEEKAEINALLNQGGLAAKGAVKYLMDTYNRANNVEVNPADPLANSGRGGVPNAANGPLTASEYSAAVQQLNNKLNGRLDGSPEYEALQRRRAAGVRR